MNRLLAAVLARPLGSLVTCLCLAVLGLVAAGQVRVNFTPATRYPVLTVTTQMGEAGPSEIETQITRPLEDALRDVAGVRKVFSTSRPGLSTVTLELKTEADVSVAAQEASARLKRLRRDLPATARNPVLGQQNPRDKPVVVLGVSREGGDQALFEAGRWAREELIPRLRRIPGVAEAELSGAPEPQIEVVCDEGKLTSLGLSVHMVAVAARQAHESLPGGVIEVGDTRLSLRTAGRALTAAQVATLPIHATAGGSVVTLGEVAQVSDTFHEPDQVSRLGGRPVAAISLYMTAAANLGGLWQDVNQVLAWAGPRLPAGMRLEVVYSQAQRLDEALGRLAWVALLAALAAAAVLWLFLRRLSSTLVVLATLPFSLLLALLLLRLSNVDLDLLSLSGLALALGILMDNAVVVIEAVHHQWREKGRNQAGVLAGVAEVGGPIAFSTLTTVGAFLPLLLVSAKIRLHLGGFFWGLSLCLMASLLAALVLAPLLLQYAARLPGRPPRPGRGPGLYRRLLDAGLAHPGRLGLICLGFLALAGGLTPWLSFQSQAGLETQGFNVMLVMPPGTAPAVTEAAIRDTEQALHKVGPLERVYSRGWANQGRIMVTLDPTSGLDSDQGADRARKLLPSGQKAQYHVLPLGAGGGQTSLEVNLYGPELPELLAYYQKLRATAEKALAVKEAVLSVGSLVPHLDLMVNHEELGRYGLTTEEVGQEVRTFLAGPVALRIPGPERELEVKVMARPRPSVGLDTLLGGVRLPLPGGGLIPLAEVVRPKPTRGPNELNRENFQRVVRVTLLLADPDALGAARRFSQAAAAVAVPEGYFWELGEEVEGLKETRGEMFTGVGLALLLVYLIMVAATESLTRPLVVMCAAPFAAAGVALALVALRVPVTMPVYLGAVILSGLLVNVGIVMADAMARREREGLTPREAAREGALRRLRPVLMTTLSTAAASLPLLLDRGAGSATWSPLALTLAAGLIVSAAFSLFLTPVLYPLAARLEPLGRGEGRKEGGEERKSGETTPLPW
ncbi:MAG: efflux RND transporter permease subunit [Deltaproteobacteria bacterium]|nr:efflux RND transporter permease subunit [Deltaproteobacteria bacterium]